MRGSIHICATGAATVHDAEYLREEPDVFPDSPCDHPRGRDAHTSGADAMMAARRDEGAGQAWVIRDHRRRPASSRHPLPPAAPASARQTGGLPPPPPGFKSSSEIAHADRNQRQPETRSSLTAMARGSRQPGTSIPKPSSGWHLTARRGRRYQPRTTTGEAVGRGIMQGASFGFRDEGQGLIEAGGGGPANQSPMR